MTRYDCHLPLMGAAPRRFPLQQSSKTIVRKRLQTDFAHHISIMALRTHLLSHQRAGIFAGGRVQLTIVTNRRDATTVSSATEQQNACEKALADRFRASHKHHGANYSPNTPLTSGNVRRRSRSTHLCHYQARHHDGF